MSHLHVHRAENGEVLVAALAEVLATPLADPFATEIIAVPAKGVERWLAQRLSARLGVGAALTDGVCAGASFPSPARVLDDALRGAVATPEAIDAWDVERAAWPLLEAMDSSTGEPWRASLTTHLAGGNSGSRRYAVARRLSELFAAYGRARPALLRAWAAGEDCDSHGAPLPADLRWQAELWRRLRDVIGRPSPAELLLPACRRLREDPASADLPERLSLLGATRLSPARLDVLAALAEHREVHLWLSHPSPALWDALAKDPLAPGPRATDASARRVAHPLLASLGRDLRELQLLTTAAAPDHLDSHHRAPPRPPTLLGRLQDDLRLDRVTPARQRPLLDPGDRSVAVHACHGRPRQVEVLREAVLGLLAADVTLEPRDVLVMCPDVEAFAPLVAAAFGLDAGGAPAVTPARGEPAHPAARLRVRLADRALRQANPLLALLSALLELAGSRITASQLLDLAGSPPVRQRFGFDTDDLERLRDWVPAAGVRWGLTREHRAAWRLDRVGQGTWRAGLDRILAGVALQESDGWLGSALPLDDVDSGDLDLAGRLAEFVDRVESIVDALHGERTVGAWVEVLTDGVLGLGDAPPDASWQVTQLQTELADIAASADGSPATLSLPDLTAVFDRRLRGRPTRASFRTGTLTVCTLTPMRSVPHRVVCLLGLDDGAFPRRDVPDGDDILARDPRVGERDPRSEDRQLLLDAVCAAQDHLVVTCTGADERSGARVPPAVPLGELLDALDATARTPDGSRVRDAVTVRHPLQPFDSRNFTAGALGSATPFSFDAVALAGAVAARAPREVPEPFLRTPLTAVVRGGGGTADVELDALLRLLEHPARGFLRQRLGVVVSRPPDEPPDALALALEPLQSWALGDRLLRARLAGVEPAACIEVELRRGELPPGELGRGALLTVGAVVERLVHAASVERAEPAAAVDVTAALAGGRRVTGTVPGVRGDVLLALSYSTLAAKHRLRAWVQLLALTVARPTVPWRAVTVGRFGRDKVQRSLLGPLGEAEAVAALTDLVSLYAAGLRSPLPAPLATTAAYAGRRATGNSVAEATEGAAKEWVGASFGGERDQPDNALVWGESADLAVLLVTPAQGRSPLEPTRLGQIATQLWDPLLAAESWAYP